MHRTSVPARDPLAFARAVADLARERAIDWILPAFEEGIFLARYAELLPAPLAPRQRFGVARLERINPGALARYPGFEWPVPPPLPGGWRQALTGTGTRC